MTSEAAMKINNVDYLLQGLKTVVFFSSCLFRLACAPTRVRAPSLCAVSAFGSVAMPKRQFISAVREASIKKRMHSNMFLVRFHRKARRCQRNSSVVSVRHVRRRAPTARLAPCSCLTAARSSLALSTRKAQAQNSFNETLMFRSAAAMTL